MSDKKLDLIERLLAKAESTTPEEAEALTEHAERLMIKYGIERARLDARRTTRDVQYEPIITDRLDLHGSYALDLRDGFAAVARALGLQAAHASLSSSEQVLFVYGFESDVRQAHTLLLSLQVQALVAMRSWWNAHRTEYDRETASSRTRARGSFVRGFGLGAARRIAANRQREVARAATGTDLVLVSRERRVAEHVAGLGLRRGRPRAFRDGDAANSGYREGQRAHTGEHELRGRATLARSRR